MVDLKQIIQRDKAETIFWSRGFAYTTRGGVRKGGWPLLTKTSVTFMARTAWTIHQAVILFFTDCGS